MKILFLSNEASAVPLAAMMGQEGHEIKFYIKNPEDRKLGDGFVPKVSDYKKEVSWADLVICDDTGWGKINDTLRASGVPVVGGTAVSDALEEDRGAGQRMFKALGMDTLPSHEFTDIPKAIKFVLANPKRYVVKVSGKAADDKSTTYVGQMDDGSDVPTVLEHLSGKVSQIDSVELQDAISGVEVAIGGFFNGDDFLNPILVNYEHKRLCASRTEQAGHGPAVGEMGTVGIWKDKGFRLYQQTLERFIPVLKEEGYRGYFDINCIIHNDYLAEPEKGQHIHPLEMTNRFGWPTLMLQMETMKINDLGELFLGIANGKATDFSITHAYSCCVVMGVPPFPYENKEIAEGMSNGLPVIFKDGDSEGVYPKCIRFDEDQWILDSDYGYAVVCAGAGDDVHEAQSQAYDRVRNVVIPNAIWRNDIGDMTPTKQMEIKSFMEFEPTEVIAQ